MSFRYLASVALLATVALAKTDLEGCTSSDSVVTPANGGTPYATRVYYVPDTGEICAALDCGGGRAPPKTTVPGCPSYEGTDTYSPSFLPLKTSAPTSQIASVTVTTPPPSSASATGAAESSKKVESESESETESASAKADTQTGTLLTITTSAGDIGTAKPGNGTLATTRSGGSQATRSSGGTAATSASTRVPNAAAPTGVSQALGLMAGVALGAVALL
ncbi:hypothetical protein C8035_v008302 [Colletotrichum spinosum]|uniref:Siderophore biosynthesis enzyme n=1 Tax=Colletotrichum spinosum TaxID=1347390 RepID=A0A4R8QCP7_9PEZI|nr:hypothetical protein C8035_v008302 [Colletotrichum spinosum]